MKKLLFLVVCWYTCLPLLAGNYRFRLHLSDKQPTEYSLQHPEAYLSSKALERRQRQQLEVDSTDLPIPTVYLQQLRAHGTIHSMSKWSNTVLLEVTDSLAACSLPNILPFVQNAECVWVRPARMPAVTADDNESEKKVKIAPSSEPYGEALGQCAMLGGNRLHEAGFRGQGLTIAVLDGGFYHAHSIALMHPTRVLGTRNFVHTQQSVYVGSDHGLAVLSCMGANVPGVMIGTAPEAAYWLLVSEDSDSEQPAEMDYWAAAIEFADSVGVDMVNSSLGYQAFDNSGQDIRYEQLDGQSCLISQVASMAASKGIVVVVSAGNSGDDYWKKITPPADAHHVLTVGAVEDSRVNSYFSSVGYSSDGRVKPDVCAQGTACTVVGADGRLRKANGTSFASPILCGMVACLWQALPQLTAEQLMQAVREGGDNFLHPNEIFGYGIPDFWQTYQLWSKR